MTSESPHDRLTRRAPRRGQEQGTQRGLWQSWAASLLLHALVLGAAVLLVASLQLAPQPDAFRWEVAVTDAPPTPQTASPTPPTATAPTPPPAPPQTVRPTTPPPPAPQRASAPVQEPAPAPPPTPVPTPSAQQPRQEPVHQPPVVPEVQPVVKPVVPPPPHPPVERPVERIEPRPAEPAPTAVTPPPQDIAHQPTATPPPPPPSPTAMSEPVATTTAHSTVSTAPETPQAAPSPSSVPPAPVTAPAPPTNTQDQVAALPPADHAAATPTAPAPKADYSWLAQSLLGLVSDNLRYPADARLNRWEGKVVVKLTVTASGEIENATIVRSSGHETLDKEALALLQRLSPLRLDRPLGKDRIALQIPIRYSLR